MGKDNCPVTMPAPYRYEFHTDEGIKFFDSDFTIPSVCLMVGSVFTGAVMLSAMPASLSVERAFKYNRELYWGLANG